MFTGRRWDPQLRLYDYRTRYYDPALGRFLRLDTIGLYGDPNNLGNPYSYVGNNPWTHTDPYGEGVLGWMLAGDYQASDWEILKGAGQGALEGATVVADAATFGLNESLHARSTAIQDDAYARGDVLSQVGFGAGKVGVEAGYAALTMGAGSAVSASVRGTSIGVRAAQFGARHAGSLARVSQAGAVLGAAGAGWSAGTAIDAGMQGDWNTATHMAGRALMLGAGAKASADAAGSVSQKAATRSRVLSNIEQSRSARQASNFGAHSTRERVLGNIARSRSARLASGFHVHGNDARSMNPQHLYDIYEMNTGDVVKTGISGQALNKGGGSARALAQVNAANARAGANIYTHRVVQTNIPGRRVALELERTHALYLHNQGNSMRMHVRPAPWR